MQRKERRWLWIIVFTFTFSPLAFAQNKAQNANQSSEQSAVKNFAAQLIGAKTDEERTSFVKTNKDLVTVELQRSLLREGIRILTQEKPTQALSIFHFAQTVAEQIDDKLGVALALNDIGEGYR